jgi:hypothetical protein
MTTIKSPNIRVQRASAAANIAYCKIFPSVGIARLGNSPGEFFIGPEAPDHVVTPAGGYRDLEERVKRQAARFRVYGFDASGNVVHEITNDDAGEVLVEWSIELANRKASWFIFEGVKKGMQSDKGKGTLRNKAVQARGKLEITPAAQSISGNSQNGPRYRFAGGHFYDIEVFLGEVKTDAAGRLIVLGGHGQSGHISNAKPIGSYANNDGWYDDTSDGPVRAKVKIAGKDVPVKGIAWVIVAPPKFTPTLGNVVTLYEVMEEASGIKPPNPLSFSKDIYPIFARMADYQWVNAMALRGHGPRKGGNFRDPQIIAALADASSEHKSYRDSVFQRIRNPRTKTVDQANYFFMPMLSGDEGDAEVNDPAKWLYLTENQYAKLESWAAGNFTSDWEPNIQSVPLEDLPIPQQPEALTKAALQYCVGGPFFPGIEITYIARDSGLYEEPFRFKDKFAAGEMTKRSAVPWQADFYECQIHWWPAQRPDDVLNEDVLEKALQDYPEDERDGQLARAVTNRIRWDRGVGDQHRIPPDRYAGDQEMVDKWSSLGFVVPHKTSAGEILLVEEGRSPYDGLRDRDYFYYLLNLNRHSDFIPYAKRLADRFLQSARDLLDSPDPTALDDMYRFFSYTPTTFGNRLDEIYAYYQQQAEADPLSMPDNIFKRREDLIERVRQFAPLNQMDGAWIRNIGHAGPIDAVTAYLFNIWMDEMGDGNENQNHANVYTQLCEKVGVLLQPVTSRDYADNPTLLDSAFTVPMYELAISQFTPTYFPEILGMTLQLEWEVLALKPTIKLFQHFGIDPHFYELHVGIDNAASGHGAKARAAVVRYLDEAQQRGGSSEVQRQWRRIWEGYVAFATTGTLADDLRKLLKQRQVSPESPRDRVIDVITKKAPYGRLNHMNRQLSGSPINDLFEDPEAFLKALIENNYIVPGSPAQSSFFRYISFDGPMYKVFTEEEVDVWRDWVVSLAESRPPSPHPSDPARLMAKCIETLKQRQIRNPGHSSHMLTGADPNNPATTISQSVAEWFEQPPRVFMKALSDPANGWISKGDSARSRFITDLLDDPNPNLMKQAFQDTSADAGGKTWRDVAAEWIDAGCPLPSEPEQPHARAFARSAAVVGRTRLGRLTLTSGESEVASHPRGRVLGMGVVH